MFWICGLSHTAMFWNVVNNATKRLILDEDVFIQKEDLRWPSVPLKSSQGHWWIIISTIWSRCINLSTLKLFWDLLFSWSITQNYWLTHSSSHSLPDTLTACLAHSLTHSLTYTLTHSFTHSLTQFTHSCTHSLTHSLTVWFNKNPALNSGKNSGKCMLVVICINDIHNLTVTKLYNMQWHIHYLSAKTKITKLFCFQNVDIIVTIFI